MVGNEVVFHPVPSISSWVAFATSSSRSMLLTTTTSLVAARTASSGPRPGHVGRCVGRTCRQPRQIVNCTSQKWVYHEVAVRRQDLIRAPQSFHAPSASSCRVPNAQSASSCRFLAATTRTIMTVHGSFIWHLLDSPKQRSPETYQRPLIDQNDADQRGGTRVRPQMPESTDAEMVVWSAEGKLRAVCLLHHARAPNCRLQSERLTSLLHPFFPRRGEGCFVRR